ncbi:MAG TPA: hypothetical protein VF629_02170 [Hymenobacter sp.]|jgi:hypothetical protein|uniref:hypothetical protein n=1 Tax=Hymenobacter sp. TaxID=1898978 RepID=UPI002EDB8D7A
MTRTLASLVIAICLFLTAASSQAQYAFNNAPRRAVASADADPGEATKPVAYKVLHGVVQGPNGALPGATVWLQGTRTVVVTNSEGEFELSVPTTAKQIKLTCGFGGLYEEVVTLAPVKALGSIYLLRSKAPGAVSVAAN